jgi:hypothetical protein
MVEITSRLKSVTDKGRWAERGASFVAKTKATKQIWFPPAPVETGKKAADTAKKATKKTAGTAKKSTKGAAKKTTGAAKKSTGAAKKTANGTKKAASSIRGKNST